MVPQAQIADRETGEDLYPRVLEALARDTDPGHALLKKMAELYRLITYPHATHIGEYLSFAWEYTGGKWPLGRESHKAGEPLRAWSDEVGACLRGEKPVADAAALSREMGVPMILAHARNRRERFISGNVVNDRLYVPNLLADGVVEVPVEVDRDGVHPITIAPLPEGLAALCRTQMAIQKLTVQAYADRSKRSLLHALLLDPVVNSLSHAEKLIDEMLDLQADYLPRFD